jgi:hypothetical protein
MSLWTKTLSIRATKVVFVVEAKDGLPEERVLVTPDQIIFDEQGVKGLTASQLVIPMLNAPAARDYFLSEGKPEHVWFRIEWDTANAPPFFLEKIAPRTLRRVKSVIVEGPAAFTVSGLLLRRGRVGATTVAWGKTVVFDRDAMFVATRDSAGVEKMSISISGTSMSTVALDAT